MADRRAELVLPEGSSWHPVSPEVSARKIAGLRMEVAPGHILSGRLDDLEVVAADGASGDILLAATDGSAGCSLVHPAYSGRQEPDPLFPWTVSIGVDELPELFRPKRD